MIRQFKWLKMVWGKLIEPSNRIQSLLERQNARMLLTVFTVILPPGLISSIILPLTNGNNILDRNEDSSYVFYSLGAWLFVYSLARSRYYKVSIWLAITTGIAIITPAAVVNYDYKNFFFLTFILMFSGLFFSLRELLIVYILCQLSIASSLFFYAPESFWEGTVFPATVVSIGGLLSLVGAQHLRNIITLHYKNELLYEAQFRTLLENSYDGLAEIKDEFFVRVDSSFAGLFGFLPKNLVGRPITDVLSHERDRDEKRQIIETIGKTTTGEIVHLEILYSSIPTIDTQNQFIAVRDITKRKVEEKELKQQALYDPVTGLFNRTQLLKHVQHRRDSPHNNMQTSLLFLDLDNFKTVNDQFGHDAGDKLLKIVGERLKNAVREGDIVTRYGGDEFVVVCDYPVDDTYTIAQRILLTFHVPFRLEENASLKLTTSIGIVRDISQYSDVDEILRAADKAMYCAKDKGKNKFDFAVPEKANLK